MPYLFWEGVHNSQALYILKWCVHLLVMGAVFSLFNWNKFFKYVGYTHLWCIADCLMPPFLFQFFFLLIMESQKSLVEIMCSFSVTLESMFRFDPKADQSLPGIIFIDRSSMIVLLGRQFCACGSTKLCGFFFLCIIAGLFFTAGGQVGRYTKGEGTKENAADDFKLMEHATWSFCTTVPCSRFF